MISSDWQSQILRKKFGSQKLCVLLFLKIGSFLIFQITYSDSLQWLLTSDTGKIHTQTFGAQILVKGTKITPETRFFGILPSLIHYFSLELHTKIACNNVWHLVEVKPTKKIFGYQIWVKTGQNWVWTRFFVISSSLVY